MKRVSVIMTTYNSVHNLEKTLVSVMRQDYPLIEVIICDGGSTDGTLDIIRKYEKVPGLHLKWKSEPDKGIYDAMNKGYKMSTGSIVTFFNDVYSRADAVRLCVEAIEKQKSDGAHADLVYADGDEVVRRWKMGEGTIRQGWMPGHPTLFLKREIYEKYGLYKTDYKVAADYEFMVRILNKSEVTLTYVSETIVKMYYGGTSTQGMKGYLTSLKEGHRALKENGINNAWIVDIKRTVKVLRQF